MAKKLIYNINFPQEREQDSVRGEGVIICDSGAGFLVFKDISLFPYGVWEADNYTLVSGIKRDSGYLRVTQEGITIFGLVGYSKLADVNIISLADIQQNCTDWYGQGNCIFVKQNNREFKFQMNSDRIFTWSEKDLLLTMKKDAANVFSIVTVEGQKKLYTHSQVKGADRARKLQANMGYINEHKIIEMIRSNQINNCNVTEADVRNSLNIYRKSIDYLKGNSNGKKSEAVKFEGIKNIPYNVPRLQMLSMDIMTIGKQLLLVTVANPLEMTFLRKLNGKSEIELGDAIINEVDKIERKGFTVDKIVWDSESAVRSANLSSRIQGRVNELEILEPGRHVARVERKRQNIKKMFRAIRTGSVYDWDTVMDYMCVQYCVNRINHIPVQNSTGDQSPWSKFTGTRADMSFQTRIRMLRTVHRE